MPQSLIVQEPPLACSKSPLMLKEVMIGWAQDRGDLGQDYMKVGPGKKAD